MESCSRESGKAKLKSGDMYVDVKAECFRTGVRFPPPPPSLFKIFKIVTSFFRSEKQAVDKQSVLHRLPHRVQMNVGIFFRRANITVP
jgi:hypothetical protein